MGFLGLSKKKKVPQELPDLISDEIEKESKEVHDFMKEEEKKKEIPSQLNELEKMKKEVEENKEKEKERSSKEIVSRLIKNVNETAVVSETKLDDSTELDKSFFDELQQTLNGEIGDLDKLGEWYEQKFLPRDILSDMKGYWEKQKADSVLKILGRNFQEKISEKLTKLQTLERGWQNTYFELVEKEEEIKEQEKELKDLLNEFVEICKTKKKSLEVADKKKEQNEKK